MIKCIKKDGFIQVKGNEDKIIEALLNNDYYDEWKVNKDKNEDEGEDITFDLCRKNKGLQFVNHPQVYFKIEDTGKISVSMNMSPTKEVYYATTFSPKFKSESMEMIMNAPNFIQLETDYKKYGVATKLTLKEKTYMLCPGDILLFNQTKELTHVLENPTLQTLINNGFYGVDSNEKCRKSGYI